MSRGAYNYVFQCKSMCVCEGGRERKGGKKVEGRGVMEREIYLIAGSR